MNCSRLTVNLTGLCWLSNPPVSMCQGIDDKGRMTRLAAFVSAAVVLVFLTGCMGGASSTREGPPVDAQARQLMLIGNFADAAQAYTRASKDSWADEDVTRYRILAAHAWMSADDLEMARASIKGIDGKRISKNNRPLVDLLGARLKLQAGRPAEALALMPEAGLIDEPLTRVYTQTRVGALDQLGPSLDLVRARADLDFQLTQPEPRQRNHDAIWSTLQALNPSELEAVRTAPPDSASGWVELALLHDRYGADAASLRAEIDRWQLRYPGHPAWFTLAPSLLERSEQLSVPADRVALLLPLTGGFAEAAAAVRDGFIAAWLNERGTADSARVSVIDTNGVEVVAAYRAAIDNGAQFIVGPLRKESVTEVRNAGLPQVTTLALNSSDTPEKTDRRSIIFEMPLSPELEAEQVANRIWFDGHVTVAMISPSGPWGERVNNAFSAAFRGLGGRVVEHQEFDPASRDLSKPVALLLNIDESQDRYRALKSLLARDIKHEVRRRQDIDAIFMAAFSDQARALRPQLRFHRATHVPVYATSHVFTGQRNAQADQDIDGVLFGDMPWLLDANLDNDPVKRQLQTHWSQQMTGYARLFALGADAAGLVGQLGKLRSGALASYDGYTGELSIDEDNRIVRKLQWAVFQGGVPQTLDGLPFALPRAGQSAEPSQ